MIQKKYFIFFVVCFMAGCAQTATKYKTNLGSRTAELASINEASSKISIGEITRNSAGIDMSCRLSTISFENGENVETYIKMHWWKNLNQQVCTLKPLKKDLSEILTTYTWIPLSRWSYLSQ